MDNMCGIAGWIDFKQDIKRRVDIVKEMAETLSFRGPDETNVWIDHHAGFGHKRLAVVDLEGGKQPMTRTKNGNQYTICYNGELYNTEDIRKELLRQGYTFRGHSDTEVLLSAYMEWKEECVHHLNGIFSFAIWDEEKEQVFIARDRLGVKPLFFHALDGKLIFGSELKAVLAHPDVSSAVGYDGLAEIFGLGPSRSPGHGLFCDIKELRPAHLLLLSRNGMKIKR
jgi:asparagine synthase (glutamine-hydrolysing)